MTQFYCGFDLGGTKMLCVVMDEKQKIVARKRKKTKGTEGAQAGVTRIADLVRETFAENDLPIHELKSLGVGCPGPVDMDQGIVNVAVNLGWKNVSLAAMLEDALDCPVSVLNDVDAGVYGEYCAGAAIGARSVAGIFPGTGIGGGFVYEGQILRGRRSSCMEIGHTKIASTNRTSGVDMPGTLESEASRLAIAAECAKLAYRGEAPNLLRAVGTDIAQIRSKVLAASIRDGDKAVENVVRQAAQTVGYAVVNLVHMLCPEVIILGGGLVEALEGLYLDEVNRIAKKNILPCYSGMFEIKMAKLGDDAGAMGAALWGQKKSITPAVAAL
ncbi:ROK family protein [Pirellulaceae bacterium SH467]|jgi:glucokinase